MSERISDHGILESRIALTCSRESASMISDSRKGAFHEQEQLRSMKRLFMHSRGRLHPNRATRREWAVATRFQKRSAEISLNQA